MEDPAPQPTLRVHDDAKIASPSAQIIADANAPETLDYIDAEGRAHKLTVTLKPGVLAPLRLDEAAGDLAMNGMWMHKVRPLIYLKAIDSDPVFPPKTKLEIEALIQRLDEEGMGALSLWYTVNVTLPIAKAMQEGEEALEKAKVKNG